MALYRRGAVWWCEFVACGVRHRESCRTSDRDVALYVMAKRKLELSQKQWNIIRTLKKHKRMEIEEIDAMVNDEKPLRELMQVVLSRVIRGKTPETEPTISLQELSSQWLEAKKGKASIRDDKQRWKSIIDHFGKTRNVNKITATDIEEWREALKQKGSSIATVNRYLALLKAGLNFAEKRGYGHLKPFATLEMEKEQPRERYCSVEELEQLLKVANGVMRNSLVVAYETGMRRSELAGLSVADVNKDEEGNNYIKLKKTKNHDKRIVPINKKAYDALALGVAKSPDYISKQFVKIAREAGVKNMRWHDLRASFAVNMLKAGLNTIEVARLTGHRNLEVLNRVYARLQEQDIIKARMKAETKTKN